MRPSPASSAASVHPKQLEDIVHRLVCDLARLDHALLQLATVLDTAPLREDLRLARRRILTNVRDVSFNLFFVSDARRSADDSMGQNEPRLCFLFAAILEALLLRLARALRLLEVAATQQRSIVTGTEERSRCFFALGRSVPTSRSTSRRVSFQEEPHNPGEPPNEVEEIRVEHKEVQGLLETFQSRVSATATPWDALASVHEVEKRRRLSLDASYTTLEEKTLEGGNGSCAPPKTEGATATASGNIAPIGEVGRGGVRHFSTRKKVAIGLAGLVGLALIITAIVMLTKLL